MTVESLDSVSSLKLNREFHHTGIFEFDVSIECWAPNSTYPILYHFDWFGLGCDLWPDGRNFGYVQCWCDRGHGLKFGRPRETEGGSSKVCSGTVGEKSLIVVKNEWLGQSGDLITHWWQLIIEERREDWILLQFPSIILLYLSIWTPSIFLIDISKKNVAYDPHL